MKALKFLKHMKQTDTPYNFRECELDEAIAELEAVMKPKTCEWCKYGIFESKIKYVTIMDEEIECCFVCVRNCNDYYEPKVTP